MPVVRVETVQKTVDFPQLQVLTMVVDFPVVQFVLVGCPVPGQGG